MSVYSLYLDDLGKGSLAREVFSRSLAMVLTGELGRPNDARGVTVSVARPAEIWRVPARSLLQRTPLPGRCSDADAAYRSNLLGYTAAQTRRATADAHRHEGYCMYALLDRVQRARVSAIGKRCFGNATDLEALTLYNSHTPLRLDAYQRVPRGLVLARMMMNYELSRVVFGDWETHRPKPFITFKPTSTQARTIVKHQHANIEFLTARGWRGGHVFTIGPRVLILVSPAARRMVSA